MDRRAFLRNSLLGVAAGSLTKNSLLSVASAADGGITPPSQQPRVVIISDIKAGSGDPDDRQSMSHLLMYANEVKICGIWPDDISSGLTATRIAIDNYEKDYNNSAYNFKKLGYPTPAHVRTKLFTSHSQAISAIKAEASLADSRPIYMLVWGGTHRVPQSLEQLTSQERSKIRLISIATYLLDNALANGDGRRYNWNAWGEARNNIWQRFPDVWWLEMDWSWLGMAFNEDLRIANEAVALNNRLARDAGALGAHIKEVLPEYFRALDTNSLLYVLDPANNLDDPTQGSWAGRYVRPFPERPNYYIGIDGGYEWNYRNPASTWSNANNVLRARIRTCISQRNAWHQAFIQKVQQLYGHEPISNPPTVTTGPDAAIQLPADSITLTGAISGLACDVATYRWSQVSGPSVGTLNGATSLQLTVQNLQVAGTYIFRLTATDVCGGQATDDVQVKVLPPNNGPVANAGPDQTVADSDGDGVARVFLNGTGSLEGTGSITSYVWKDGSKVLATANAGSVSINLPIGVHNLTLTVTDDRRMTASDSVTITVTGDASPDDDDGADSPSSNPGTLYRAINLNGEAVTVDGTRFEGKNAPNYSTVGNTYTSNTVPRPTVENGKKAMLQNFIWGNPVGVTLNRVPNAIYRVYLWIFEDNSSVTYSLDINGNRVITNNQSGTAGTWRRLDLGNIRVSDGQLSLRATLPADGLNICAVEAWHMEGGAPAQNQPPSANAGQNQTVTSDGNGVKRVVLDGTGSTDSDGRIVSYVWQKDGTTLATTANPALDLAVGVHTLTLTVTDNNGLIDSDSVTITVNAGTSSNPDTDSDSTSGNDSTNTDDSGSDNGEDPSSVAGTLYRAINLNGDAITVDGTRFEGKNASNYSTVGNTYRTTTLPRPAVDNATQVMLQNFIWGSPVGVTLNRVPNAVYRVYLWIFEDNSSVTYSLDINGNRVITDGRSGAAGTWQRLDLGLTTVRDGQLSLRATLPADGLNICAIEVWRR